MSKNSVNNFDKLSQAEGFENQLDCTKKFIQKLENMQFNVPFKDSVKVSADALTQQQKVFRGHYIVYFYNTLRKTTEGPALQIQDFDVFFRNLNLIDLEKITKLEKEDPKFQPSMIEKFPTEYTLFVLGYFNTETCYFVQQNYVLEGNLLNYYSDNSRNFYDHEMLKLSRNVKTSIKE